MIVGRPLDVEDITVVNEGETNYIMVDRNDLLSTAFDEVKAILKNDIRQTLEVQFYNEVAADYGGPRKEFFRIIFQEIYQKYFENGLRDILSEDYEVIGKIFALSILQNGKIPRIFDENTLKEMFSQTSTSPCIMKLRDGLNVLGIYEVCRHLPSFVFLFHQTSTTLTFKKLTYLLKPDFDTEGTNRNIMERKIYSAFLKYLRLVASGRRQNLCLGSILQFITGADVEPTLGFQIQPSIRFIEAETSNLPTTYASINSLKWKYLPTANTCINSLTLPRPTVNPSSLPEDEDLFSTYDYAFCNTYYGLQ